MTTLYSGHGARRVRLGLQLAIAGVVGAMALCAPSAFAVSATDQYLAGSVFGNDGFLASPNHIAVEPGTGNVLITDPGYAEVAVYSPRGATFLSLISMTSPQGIAIDQTTGAIYVGDSSDSKIHKFVSDAQPFPTYTEDTATWTSPALGSGAGQLGDFNGAIAVDPTTHDVLVADSTNHRVTRFDSSGAPVANGSFDGADTAGGPFTNILALAVAPSGTIYVDDTAGDVVVGGAGARIERFTSAGVSTGALTGITTPTGVAVSPTGQVLIAEGAWYGDGSPRMFRVYDGTTGLQVQQFALDSALRGLGRVAVAGNTAYVLDQAALGGSPGPAVQYFTATSVPGVAVDAAENVGTTTADFKGVVTPGLVDADVHFEYSLDGGATWPKTPDQPVAAGSDDAQVSATATGLRPNTTYKLRLHASNADGAAADSSVVTFTTDPVPPVVSGTVVTDRTTTSASIRGKVVSYGAQTTFHVEYGTTTAYGGRVPANVDDTAGAGYTARAVTEPLTSLIPGTVYHARLVARNASGTEAGPDVVFTTRAAAGPTRAYEQVTPTNKDGLVLAPHAGYLPGSDGDSIAYMTNNAPDRSDVDGASKTPVFVSKRGTAGWSFRSTDAAQLPLAFPTVLALSTLAVADDGSKALVVSNRALAPGAFEGGGNLYIRDVASGALEFVAGLPSEKFYEEVLAGFNGSVVFSGAARDFSTVAFTVPNKLTPDASAGQNVYQWSHGTLSLVSVLPDGSPATGGTAGAGVSQDGRKVFFESGEGVFVRHDGQTTAMSVSRRPGAPAYAQQAHMRSITPDGRYAVFQVDNPVGLTTDAPDSPGNVYRYDVETGALQYLVTTSEFQPPAVISATGSSVMFAGAGQDGRILHDGAVGIFAPNGFLSTERASLDMSPNGRYVVFSSSNLASSYDNRNLTECQQGESGQPSFGRCLEVYVYDAVQHALTCVSCPADGSRSTGHAYAGSNVVAFYGQSRAFVGKQQERAVTDDGQVFFDTPTPLARADVNGGYDAYVYEDGDVMLLSSGARDTSARFVGVAGGGRDAFIVTSDQLVKQDRDNQPDLYDVRVGGGIAGQNAANTTAAACGGPECREPTAGPLPPPRTPSQGAPGDGNEKPPVTKPKVSVAGMSFTSNAAHVRVKVSGRGLIRVSGTAVKTASRSVTTAGTYTIVAKYTSKTQSARRHRRKVKVALKASLTPPFGSVASAKTSRTLGK